jgi:hypothetical protein
VLTTDNCITRMQVASLKAAVETRDSEILLLNERTAALELALTVGRISAPNAAVTAAT